MLLLSDLNITSYSNIVAKVYYVVSNNICIYLNKLDHFYIKRIEQEVDASLD